MLSKTIDILLDAEKHNYAVAAFSVYNWETVNAAIKAAEKVQSPVILALAERYLDYMDIEVFAEMARITATKTRMPVSLHMDHAYKSESIIRAIKAGFSSVMFDGSHLSFEMNVQKTREIVELAHAAGVSVEAELGSIARGENSDEEAGEDILTDPKMAGIFVEQTKADFLAPAIGTVHGMYASKPQIDIDRLAEIQQQTSKPLVLHGGSDTPEDRILATISRGIRKININTEISMAAVMYIKEALKIHSDTGKVPHLSGLNEEMQAAMRKVMEKYMVLFTKGTLSLNS